MWGGEIDEVGAEGWGGRRGVGGGVKRCGVGR